MKKIRNFFLIVLVLAKMIPLSAYADVNFDGSGSGIGTGSKHNNFHYGDAGIRVTIFDK